MTAVDTDCAGSAVTPLWQDTLREAGGRVLVVGMSKDRNAKVVVLLFDDGDRRPRRVAKLPSTDEAERQLLHEFHALGRVRPRLDPALRDTVPEPLQLLRHRGRAVTVVSAVPGKPGLVRYHGWRHTARRAVVRADFDAAGHWLARLQSATGCAPAPLEPLAGVTPALVSRFGDDSQVDRDVDRLQCIAKRLGRHIAPRTAVHGDYWFGNLLFGSAGLTGVVDWEASVAAGGEPVHDLARFFVGYSLYLDRHAVPGRRVLGHPGLRSGSWGDGVRFAVDGDGWYPALARRFLGEGLRRLGVSPHLGRDIVLAELVTVAAHADDHAFAAHHLSLFRRLTERR